MAKETENNNLSQNWNGGKLDKILSIIESKENSKVIDILTAIMLSLATIGSAWCAYQSTLWGGVQTFELATANRAGRLASENFVKLNQKLTMDGIILMNYIEASENGNKKLESFFFNRFDSVLKNSTLEWLKSDPYQNEKAPISPMLLDSYKRTEEKTANDQLILSAEKMESANEARNISNRYVLFTVLFAGVLFFGGIASTIQSLGIRRMCMIISAIILFSTIYFLIIMPAASI